MQGFLLFPLPLLLALGSAPAQSVVSFNFDSARLYAPLPVDVVEGGVTAHLSATGSGFSIQGVGTVSIVPVGFSGHFIYPSSINASDLLIGFSRTITAFSIQYAPNELGCDDSARMRVTAYANNVLVGTNTTTARHPGTWPVETLSCTFAQGFDRVVVHYDAPPPTCQDYGTIFIADNMAITLAPVHVPGSTTNFGTGCAGSNGVLRQIASGTPEVGFPVTFDLAAGPSNTTALLGLGFDNSMFQGLPLPLDLSPYGFSGCWLLTELPLNLPQSTDASGGAHAVVPIPLDIGLIGHHVYTQYWALDATSVVFSDAIDTAVGGYL
ncbi:MAG: hypothetical protein U1F36_12610 [Planctomycetota bacterium]